MVQPESCDNPKCEAIYPRCTVCRSNFVAEIDEVCQDCSESTICDICNTTGHKKLYEVDADTLETYLGGSYALNRNVRYWLCQQHFANAYGPEPHFGTMSYCIECSLPTKEEDLDLNGLCTICRTKHGTRPCMNITCNNSVSVYASKTDNFCDECGTRIEKNICTNCDRKMNQGELVDMYGHCSSCRHETHGPESVICKGCQTPFTATPVGQLEDLCIECEGRIQDHVCTSCFDATDYVDEYGRCLVCNPDARFSCIGDKCKKDKKSGLPSNKVSKKNTMCAKCEMGVD